MACNFYLEDESGGRGRFGPTTEKKDEVDEGETGQH